MSFHGVLGSAVERLDPKILFDPFEEQLDLPATFEEQSNRQGWQDKVVRQKDKTAMFFDIEETDSPKWIGIELRGFWAPEQNGLIASQSGSGIDSVRGSSNVIEVAFGPGHKKRHVLCEPIEATKIDVSTVHDVERSWFE